MVVDALRERLTERTASPIRQHKSDPRLAKNEPQPVK